MIGGCVAIAERSRKYIYIIDIMAYQSRETINRSQHNTHTNQSAFILCPPRLHGERAANTLLLLHTTLHAGAPGKHHHMEHLGQAHLNRTAYKPVASRPHDSRSQYRTMSAIVPRHKIKHTQNSGHTNELLLTTSSSSTQFLLSKLFSVGCSFNGPFW